MRRESERFQQRVNIRDALALVSLTHGTAPASRALAGGWRAIARRWPGLVGGRRPIELRDLVTPGGREIVERDVVISSGVQSEVLIATRLDGLRAQALAPDRTANTRAFTEQNGRAGADGQRAEDRANVGRAPLRLLADPPTPRAEARTRLSD